MIPATPVTLVTVAVVLLAADRALLLLVLATIHLAANVMTVETGITTVMNAAALGALMVVTET